MYRVDHAQRTNDKGRWRCRRQRNLAQLLDTSNRAEVLLQKPSTDWNANEDEVAGKGFKGLQYTCRDIEKRKGRTRLPQVAKGNHCSSPDIWLIKAEQSLTMPIRRQAEFNGGMVDGRLLKD